jgi:hypothetical protein
VHQGEHEGAAGLHKAADVDGALGGDAVERRDHALIGLLLGKNPDQALLCRDVRLGDADRGILGFEAEAIGVELRGRPALLDQGADAVIGHLGELPARLVLAQRRLRLHQRRLGLGNLVIELGRS